ncbi:MAG: D-alanine--D-alanine ligase [Parvularcula sp.]|nr:D-alanine--D-alanine ligase [Parvularcula sp.]
MDQKAIFSIGNSKFDFGLVREIAEKEGSAAIKVLDRQDVQPSHGRINFEDLYARAKEAIDESDVEPDAIIGDLDFPVTSLVSLLRREYDLPGASPEAVAKCEHKYWMRFVQSHAFPDDTPNYKAINPFATGRGVSAPEFPFWLKPVKGHSSVLGFMVEDTSDLDKALHTCRQRIHLIGEPFNEFLNHVEVDPEVAEIDGNYAIAEGIISASRQFTLEGYVWNGNTVIYGVVASIREGQHRSSFSSYQYPADLPEETTKRASEITARLIDQIGYDNAPFNIEFFWDPDEDKLHILEINPRISKSHAPLFRMVDGVSHHKVAIDLALGRQPEMPRGEGENKVAAKYMLRSHEADGIVADIPDKDQIEKLAKILPDINVNILVEKGVKLSELFYQDSYSYELADIFLGGDGQQMLEDEYNRCIDSLTFLIKPIPATS